MYLSKIKIQNFRLLKDTILELDENEKKDLTLLIGKNNSGKTSFIMLFDKVFKSSNIDFNDFSIHLRDKILEIDDTTNELELTIRLILEIGYNAGDNLDNISEFILDLDTTNNCVKILFEYSINKKKLINSLNQIAPENKNRFIDKHLPDFIELNIYAFDDYDAILNKRESLIRKEKKDVEKLINYEVIHAKREVASSEADNQKGNALSNLSTKFYKQDNKFSFDELNKINSSIFEMDKNLDDAYNSYFTPFLKNTKDFLNIENIKVISDLQSKEILSNHSKIVYGEKENYLPEYLNGLGYMNILYLLLSIEIKKRFFIQNKKDINLLFIEEPEAHTHPQLQYVFIEKIKKTLKEINSGFVKENDFIEIGHDVKQIYSSLKAEEIINDEGLVLNINNLKPDFLGLISSQIALIRNILKAPNNLQTFISTHSAHIVKRCDFKDIRYFNCVTDRDNNKKINIKNFYSELEKKYKSEDPDLNEAEKKHFQFLVQYLTIGSSELFFAEKIIFIEGISESILLQYFIDKFDNENKDKTDYINLSSQNISILEVGANSRAFKHFLEFLEIKTLIITDIDTTAKNANNKYSACEVKNAENTSNYSLKYFLKAPDLKATENFKIWLTDLKENKLTASPLIQLSYQIEENSYHARSFEDAFLNANIDNLDKIKSEFDNFDFKSNPNLYELTTNVLEEFDKSKFASLVLYLALTNKADWNIPLYIKKGLEWIAKK